MNEPQYGGLIDDELQDEIKVPRNYEVIMLNDNYTTQEFVIRMLQSIFNMNEAAAYKVMLDVHQKGSGNCGSFQKEIAEAKIKRVHTKAREEGFPLRCKMRPLEI